jgi:branched-chain amino acid transport system ATP-binding protein
MAPLLNARDVTVRYQGFTAVDRVSLEIGSGEIVSIVGPNGAGKTTLVNTLTGEIRPSDGIVRFEGGDLSEMPAQAWATRGLARSFQLVAVFPTLTVWQMLAVAVLSRAHQAFNVWRVVRHDTATHDEVQRLARIVKLQGRLTVPCGALAQGEKKLLDIASALALEPKIILLDEPTSGVSTADKHSMMQTLLDAARLRGTQSIILVEHDMDLVRTYSTRIIALQAGMVVADMGPEDFFRDQRFMDSIVGAVPSHA